MLGGFSPPVQGLTMHARNDYCRAQPRCLPPSKQPRATPSLARGQRVPGSCYIRLISDRQVVAAPAAQAESRTYPSIYNSSVILAQHAYISFEFRQLYEGPATVRLRSATTGLR